MEVQILGVPRRQDWPRLLGDLARQLDDGRVYDRDLISLSVVLDAVHEAFGRQIGVGRGQPRSGAKAPPTGVTLLAVGVTGPNAIVTPAERPSQATGPLEEGLAAGSEWVDLDLVFAQPNGKAIERKSDWRAWKTLLQEAGVRDVRLHDGRHTAATLLPSEGVHPRVVMDVLGHAQMRTTTDTYSHVMPALGRDAADRMGRALWD